MSITSNLDLVQKNINKAFNNRKTKFNSLDIFKLVVVTKNQNIEAIQKIIEAGAIAIGENRIQEALKKYKFLNKQIEWHFLGHLQTNKVRQAVSLFSLIHSVDSENLALEINRVAKSIGKKQCILIQLNVSGENTKNGIHPNKMLKLAEFISKLENVCLSGIMTIAPHSCNTEIIRKVFKQTQLLYRKLINVKISNTNIKWLSMGMTNDYEIAIEEGANLVRIGSGIFGERNIDIGGNY